MAEKPVYLTAEGLAKLKAELEHLVTVRRPQVASRIQQSKESANTSENAEYDDAKNEQAFIEGRILTIENMLRNATLIEQDHSNHEVVRLGSTVKVRTDDGEEEQYEIVGSAEANPRLGKISNESPVGRALLGRHPGDSVEVAVPSGVMKLTVIEIN